MLELRKVTLDADYAKKWNEHCTDFVKLYKDGVKVSDTLYRVGGIGSSQPKDGYYLLLKYVEEYYEDKITNDVKRKPHLAGYWCILNTEGVEKIVAKERFKNLWLAGGVIYSQDSNYYNIETKGFYCRTNSVMGTDDFLFLENKWDDNESKRGVIIIDKADGTYTLFPEKKKVAARVPFTPTPMYRMNWKHFKFAISPYVILVALIFLAYFLLQIFA